MRNLETLRLQDAWRPPIGLVTLLPSTDRGVVGLLVESIPADE